MHLLLERLESRIVLTTTPPLGLVLPLYQTHQSPFGEAQADLPSAEVTAFYKVILNRTPDAAGQKYWTDLLQSGASPASVAKRFLNSADYRTLLVDSTFQNFLGRSASPRELGVWTRALARGVAPAVLVGTIASGAEYTKLHPGSTDFVQSLYEHLLGRQATTTELNAGLRALGHGAGRRGLAVGFASSKAVLSQSISEFYQAFLQRAPQSGELSYWVARARRESPARVLPLILDGREFQFQAAAGMAGKPSGNVFQFNQQLLASDPLTDALSLGNSATDPTGLVPMNSPWDNAVVLPSVPYSSIQAGGAAQPTLTLPSTLLSSVNLAQGATYQTWFQAKNPGVLLSELLPTSGSSATVTYPAPLIYINSSGKLVAGLFDQTPLSIVPNQAPLSWLDSNGQTQIGAAHPLVSQVGVLDNTWHHLAFVFSSGSQSLYLDGVLQGTSQPLTHQTSSNLTTSSTSLVVPLNQAPAAGQFIQGTISEGTSNPNYGSGATSVIATFQGWLPAGGGSALLSLTTLSSGNPSVQSVVYNSPATGKAGRGAAAGSSATLTLQLSGPNQSANALTVSVSYPTAGGAYSFLPTSSSTYSTPVKTTRGTSTKISFDAPTGALVGGTTVPEPVSNLYPATNYPQGFVGTVDEVALWNQMLSQSDVQTAMSGPVLSSGSTSILPLNLMAYFPFTQNVANTTNEWSNVVPGSTNFAQGPTQGVTLASVASTIATDPFPGVDRLPGARAWGLHLATPLTSPSFVLPAGQSVRYKVGLAAGDQLSFTVPEDQDGILTLVVEDDLGRTSQPIQLSPNSTQYLPATRTGTYQITLTWTASGNSGNGVVVFGLIPGPLNSLMELFTGYTQNVSPSQTNTVFAYSDPSLPGINPTVGTASATGMANYWPLWTDQTYFPATSAYTPSDLNQAYVALVNALKNQGNGLVDFGNLIGSPVTSPATLQQYLNAAYQSAFQSAPPSPPPTGPFPVAPAATNEQAVYEFIYNANLLRSGVYSVLTTSLPSWIQSVINTISSQQNVPSTIAATIASGQTSQVHSVNFSITQPSQKQTVFAMIMDGALWAAAGFFAALPGLGEGLEAISVITSALGGGAASLGESFLDNAYASGSNTVTYTIPVTPIINAELNYETLNSMAVSIDSAALQQWTNIASALANPNLIQSVMSNFGLLKAFQAIKDQPLSDPSMDPVAGITSSLSRTSWHEMIPATFSWTPIAPDAFPSGNGQTNEWAQAGPFPTNGNGAWVGGIANGDFNKDGLLDIALANSSSSDISVLLGTGGAFQDAIKVSLSGAHAKGASGIVSDDFNKDGKLDLAVANQGSDDVSMSLGDGNGYFQPAQLVSLRGAHGAAGLVSGDFNKDGNPDLAVANQSSDDVSILLGKGDGTFQDAVTVSLQGAYGAAVIAKGDFDFDGDEDLAVANLIDANVSVLMGKGDGTFQSAITIGLNSPEASFAMGIAVGDLNGDGVSDIAVTNAATNTLSIILVENGIFVPTNYSIPSSVLSPVGVALRPIPGRLPDLIVTGSNSNNVAVLFNTGNGSFYTPIVVATAGQDPAGITVGDFLSNGMSQVVVSNYSSNNVVLLAPGGVGNTATFLPGTSSSSTPFSGPTSLQSAVDPIALDQLLAQMESLQGGNVAWLGPFDEANLITPSNVTPPSYMAFTSLVYPPNQLPLSLSAPGLFLSLTPATLSETGRHGKTNLNYTQNGAYLNGWQLRDSNQNPIALSTIEQLFGAPTVNQAGKLVGTNLTPIDRNHPFAAYNGGWYLASEPVNGAATSWADAFFNWGQGTSSYSPRNLVPSGPLSGQLPNTATPGVSNTNISYQVSFQPTTTGPPAINTGIPVNLGTYFNRTGFVTDGKPFASGLDGGANALSGTLLGTSVFANGTQFILGSPNVNNTVFGTGQTIALPAGSFSTLNLLGTGVNGNQSNLTFTVTYTDNSTSTFTQSMSDWYTPQSYAGESVAAVMTYRDVINGSTAVGPYHLYSYAFTLAKGKTIQSITLPSDGNATFLGLTLT